MWYICRDSCTKLEGGGGAGGSKNRMLGKYHQYSSNNHMLKCGSTQFAVKADKFYLIELKHLNKNEKARFY